MEIDTLWTLIAETDVNYILQNIGAGVLLVQAKNTTPTSILGAFQLNVGAVVTSDILSGRIWAKAYDGNVDIALAK